MLGLSTLKPAKNGWSGAKAASARVPSPLPPTKSTKTAGGRATRTGWASATIPTLQRSSRASSPSGRLSPWPAPSSCPWTSGHRGAAAACDLLAFPQTRMKSTSRLDGKVMLTGLGMKPPAAERVLRRHAMSYAIVQRSTERCTHLHAVAHGGPSAERERRGVCLWPSAGGFLRQGPSPTTRRADFWGFGFFVLLTSPQTTVSGRGTQCTCQTKMLLPPFSRHDHAG